MSVKLSLGIERVGLDLEKYCYNRLGLDTCSLKVFEEIRRAAHLLDRSIAWVDENCYLQTHTVDGRGIRLSYMCAGELVAYLEPIAIIPWDKAIVAFLRALPEDTQILLWWH